MKTRQTAAIGGLAMLVSSTMAGCANSGSSADASAGLKGAPIKVGIISAETNPLSGLNVPEPRAGAEARIKAVNAAGGIDGRPLVLVPCDGKDDPNASQACARKMVQEKVVAVIGAANSTEGNIQPTLDKAGIPVLAAVPETPAVGSSKSAFCLDVGVAGDFLGAPRLLADQGAKKISMLLPGGLPGTGPATQAFNAGVAASGATNGGVVTFTAGQSQYEAEVAKATADGVDGVFAFAPATSITPLLRTLRQQAPNVKVATLTVNFGPESIKALGSLGDGLYAVGLGQPATADSAGMKMFNADMDKYAAKTDRTDFAINSWVGVWMLERIVKGLDKIDAPSVLAAASKLQQFDLGGIYPAVTTTKPFTGLPGMSCIYNTTVVYQKVDNGKLVAIDPGKFTEAFPPAPTR